jgi:hypothetical protein
MLGPKEKSRPSRLGVVAHIYRISVTQKTETGRPRFKARLGKVITRPYLEKKKKKSTCERL